MNPHFEIKILDDRLHEWGLPDFATAMAAGIDLRACIEETMVLKPQDPAVLIPTGFAMHMDSNQFAALFLPRSGLGHKQGLVLGNCVGLIDADYTLQCFVSAWNRNPPGSDKDIVINPGDRIAQMVLVPVLRPTFKVVTEFTNSSDRIGGFGSSGVK